MYIIGKKLTDEGKWFEYKGAKLLIGRAGSNEFLQALEHFEKPFKKKIARDALGKLKSREINVRALARAVLLGWENVADQEGNEVPYSEDLGYEALRADPDMLEFVMDMALDNENFAAAEEAEVAKKSSKAKSG